MAHVTYRIVEHDGGWAYRVGGTFSETFPDHDSARAAAVAMSAICLAMVSSVSSWA